MYFALYELNEEVSEMDMMFINLYSFWNLFLLKTNGNVCTYVLYTHTHWKARHIHVKLHTQTHSGEYTARAKVYIHHNDSKSNLDFQSSANKY